MTFFSFMLRRAARHWQLLLTVSLGVLIATALLASAPLLVDTVVEIGLRRTLLSQDAADTNLQLSASFLSSEDSAAYTEADEALQTIVRAHMGDVVSDIVPTATSFDLFPWIDEQLRADESVRLTFYGLADDTAPALQFLDGAWPTAELTQTASGALIVPVLISEDMADRYDLAVGAQLPISPMARSAAPEAMLHVAGIVQPRDFREPIWMGRLNPLRTQSGADDFVMQFQALLPAESFWPMTNQLFAPNRPSLTWYVLVDPLRITSDGIRPLQTQIDTLDDALAAHPLRLRVTTGLPELLDNFARQREVVQAPLFLLTAEIVLLTLYYVVMVAALAMRQVSREFAVMRSRGAAGGQIVRIQLQEALLIGAVAFVSGPLLALLLVRGIGSLGPLGDVGQVGWTVHVTAVSWFAAGFGALGSLAGLLLPLPQALQQSIVSEQQLSGRDERPSWWQRLYLDVFVMAIGLVLLWRLQQYGSLVGGSAARPQTDWLLLLAPLALLIGAGTILLRLFPLLLRALAWLAARGRGLAAPLAMWHIARNPAHVARLVLLLTLSMSLGLLASGLNATLDRSEEERARHLVGSDLRFTAAGFVPVSRVSGVPGAAGATGMLRLEAHVNAGRRPRLEVLAVETERFAELAYFREDYAARPFPEIMAELAAASAEVPVQEITRFPGRPSSVGLWVQTDPDPSSGSPFQGGSNLDRLSVQLKLQTNQNEAITVKLAPAEMGGYPADGWRYFSTPLDLLPDDAYPLSLHSIWVQGRTRTEEGFVAAPLRISFDDVTVVDADSDETQVVDSFEELTRVWQVDGNSLSSFQTTTPRSGRGKLSVSLQFSRALETLGVRLVNLSNFAVLPALASREFLAATETAVGDQLQLLIGSGTPINIRLLGELTYFPTSYNEQPGGLLVVEQKPLLSYLNESSARAVNANEALLRLAPDADAATVATAAAALVPNASQILDAETVRQTIKATPIALGLRTVTFFGYVLTTFLSLVGFATHFFMSARQRAASYGVLRALGLSPRQLYVTLAAEQIVLILAGLAVGTGLGYLLNQLTLADLPITLGSSEPIPPFVPQSGWGAVGRIYGTLTVAFFLALGAATLLLWRSKLHRVLRIGEE